MPSLEGIHYASKRVKGWMKPSRRKVGLAFQPAKAQVIYQPLGVVGIIYADSGPIVVSLFATQNRGDFAELEATHGRVAELLLDAWG